jgi:hypothetical protein
MNKDKTLDKKSWEEFRETGLLVFVNSFLHIFGWCICVNLDDNGNVTETFPSRTSFRGFSEDVNDRAYNKLAKYISEFGSIAVKESEDGVLKD